MAIISLAEKSLAKDRNWVSREAFVDLITLGNVLPGPIAVNVSTAAGFRALGAIGALAAWIGLVLPAFVACLGLYLLVGSAIEILLFQEFVAGFTAGIVAIVAAATYSITKQAVISRIDGLMLAIAALLYVANPFDSRMMSIFAVYAISLIRVGCRISAEGRNDSVRELAEVVVSFWPFILCYALLFFLGGSRTVFPDARLELLIAFGAASLALYGGAYSFIPIVGTMVVDEKTWMSMREFMEHVAIGQTSPGPVLISSASIGYSQAGMIGAVMATLGLFAPPALLMVYCSRRLDLLGNNSMLRILMTTLRPAVSGILIGGVLQMVFALLEGRTDVGGYLVVCLIAISLVVIIATRVNHLIVAFGAGCAFVAANIIGN